MYGNDNEITYKPKVEILCPVCHRRIFDVIKGTRGTISIKCPNCRTISEVSVAFRLNTSHPTRQYQRVS